jgi:signal peptidase I
VLANEFIYHFREPERGDIVVFRSPEFGGVDLIKRVVGLPGDKIEVKSGALYVNGEYQEEPYLNPALPDESSYGPMVVPPGYIFAMGDNRADSADSRFFGPVPYDHIVGEAFLRVWPLNELGSV